MPVLLPIILTASHVLAADTAPKFSVERTCRPAAVASVLPGRDMSACQRDESDAALDRAPSHVELLTCLEMASRPKSYRLSRLWAPLQTGAERQDFLPGGLL